MTPGMQLIKAARQVQAALVNQADTLADEYIVAKATALRLRRIMAERAEDKEIATWA